MGDFLNREGMVFVPPDAKPNLDEIGEFLNGRLKDTEEKPGINISHDELGNTVYTSLGKAEETFGGLVRSQLVATSEGKKIIYENPGILQGIRSGDIMFKGVSLGGHESNVYQISLNTPEGLRDFALKYTFPIEAGGINFFTSGIAAMRLMQKADREKPVPYVSYLTPILATHDVLLTPFANEGLSTADLMDYLDKDDNERDRFIEDRWNDHNPKVLAQMKELRKIEHQLPPNRKFFPEFLNALMPYQRMLYKWAKDRTISDRELDFHRFGTSDATMRQTVVDIDKFTALVKRFRSNSKFKAGTEEFDRMILSSLAFVELGLGTTRYR